MFCSSMLVVTTRTKIEISTLCPQSMCFINIYKQTFIVNKTSRYSLKSDFIRKISSIPHCSLLPPVLMLMGRRLQQQNVERVSVIGTN